MISPKPGGFVLMHCGIMTKYGNGELDARIGTDSGTGQLTVIG